MNVFLLHPDRDADTEALPWNAEALVQDLQMDPLLDAMAQGDALIRTTAKSVLLTSLTEPAAILFRQDSADVRAGGRGPGGGTEVVLGFLRGRPSFKTACNTALCSASWMTPTWPRWRRICKT